MVINFLEWVNVIKVDPVEKSGQYQFMEFRVVWLFLTGFEYDVEEIKELCKLSMLHNQLNKIIYIANLQ